jgi:2-methylcitrate dehydratase PrpD
VLALAERRNASGRDFLTAFVLGNELHCRLGLSTTAHSGWFYTSMHGVFGAAAGAARMLGLDRDGIRNALGIALSHAGGTQQPHIEKSLTKRMQSAFASRNGVFSALLAERGVGAPREALDGKFGFYAKYEPGDPAAVHEGLGTRWEILRTMPKKFPSCGCNHAAIEATLQLAHEARLQHRDVRAIEVVISPFMARLVAAPYDPSANPQVAAQFSVQYSIASALLRGHLRIADIQPAAARDPDVVAYARTITVRVDETLTDPSSMAATVLIDTHDRGRLIRTIEHLPGSPEFPLTAADVQAKFAECTSLGASPLPAGEASALAARVEALDTMTDVAQLFGAITGSAKRAARSA